MAFKEGDIVGRKSYGSDILFSITKVNRDHVLLKGLDYRLLADAPLDDLLFPSLKKKRVQKDNFREKEKHCLRRIFKRRKMDRDNLGVEEDGEEDFFEVIGKVLHLDGDRTYLAECLRLYSSLNIPVVHGEHCAEAKQPQRVYSLLEKYQPDMLILTGHDAYIKKRRDNFQSIDRYRNSRHFVEAVKIARRYEAAKDELIIFAGACQSHYEAIIEAGANFASSPQRVLIHCLDPVFVMEKISYTSIRQSVDIKEVLNNTIAGIDGLGGIETRGKLRLGLPKSPY